MRLWINGRLNMKIINPVYQWAYALTQRRQTTHLIIHHAAASVANAEDVHAYHKSLGWAGIAYHYIVRKDGTIYTGRPIGMQGGHTVGMNHCAIGICFEGNFDVEYMPDAQLEAGQELIAYIVDKYPDIKICRHSDFNATACPGKNLPFDWLVNPNDEGSVESEDAIPEWAKEALAWCMNRGITDGNRPNDTATRAEIWTMLWRALK